MSNPKPTGDHVVDASATGQDLPLPEGFSSAAGGEQIFPTDDASATWAPLPDDAVDPLPGSTFPAAPLAAITVGPPPVRVTAEKAERKPYWVGTMPGSPIWNTSVGGCSFPRSHGPMNEKGELIGNQIGQFVQLTDDQVRHVCNEIRRRVVRLVGGVGRILEVAWPGDGEEETIPNPRYVPAEGDQPLGRYLYMQPCHPENPRGQPVARPAPMFTP